MPKKKAGRFAALSDAVKGHESEILTYLLAATGETPETVRAKVREVSKGR